MIKEYKLNDIVVRFPASDPLFAGRMMEAGDKLEEIQTEEIPADADFFAYLKDKDSKMKAIIDECFGYEVSKDVFGSYSVFAMEDGLPAWLNLFEFVVSRIEETYNAETEKAKHRIEKYTKRYHK